MEVVTISSKDGIQEDYEKSPDFDIFPDGNHCLRFLNKKVIFLTSRVHPGETPGSHVLNGLVELISE